MTVAGFIRPGGFNLYTHPTACPAEPARTRETLA